MKINLKEHSRSIDILKHVEKLLAENSETKGISKKIRKIVHFLEDVETDLELGGESIVELDLPRLDAIEERNKMMKFKKDNDD